MTQTDYERGFNDGVKAVSDVATILRGMAYDVGVVVRSINAMLKLSDEERMELISQVLSDGRAQGGAGAGNGQDGQPGGLASLSTKPDPLTLPPGRYYVGDPCYVLKGDEQWDTFLGKYWKHDNTGGGPVTLNGHRMVAFNTQHGDGSYHDGDGREYPVDAGLIAMLPVDLMPAETRWGDFKSLGYHNAPGHLFDFERESRCKREVDGTLIFGTVRIPTGDEE